MPEGPRIRGWPVSPTVTTPRVEAEAGAVRSVGVVVHVDPMEREGARMEWLVNRSNSSSARRASSQLAEFVARHAASDVTVDRSAIQGICESLPASLCRCIGDEVVVRLDWSVERPVVVWG